MSQQSRPHHDRKWPGRAALTWSRRRWIRDAGLAVTGLTKMALGQAPAKERPGPGEQEVIDRVKFRSRKARLGELADSPSRTKHFLGLGNASKSFRDDALGICEALGKDFLSYFRGRGFKVEYPERRMTVIALKDVESFGAFIGEELGQDVGGQYELDDNQLLIFDLRVPDRELNVEKKRLNTLALVHETIHMLCFNSGLLSREADVPVCISEGLATYGELWLRSRGQKAFGMINDPRLSTLWNDRGKRAIWIPIDQLLSNDDLFFKGETETTAYAESWLLVSTFMKGSSAQVRKFQTYLAGFPKLGAAKKRIEYAEARLGSIGAIEQDVRRFRANLSRR